MINKITKQGLENDEYFKDINSAHPIIKSLKEGIF